MASPRDVIRERSDFRPGVDFRKSITDVTIPGLRRMTDYQIDHDGSIVQRPRITRLINYDLSGDRSIPEAYEDGLDTGRLPIADAAGLHLFTFPTPPNERDRQPTPFVSEYALHAERDVSNVAATTRSGHISVSRALRSSAADLISIYSREAGSLDPPTVTGLSQYLIAYITIRPNYPMTAASFGGQLYVCNGTSMEHDPNRSNTLSTVWRYTATPNSPSNITTLNIHHLRTTERPITYHERDEDGNVQTLTTANGWNNDKENPYADIQANTSSTVDERSRFPTCDLIYATTLGTTEVMFAVQGSRLRWSHPLRWSDSEHMGYQDGDSGDPGDDWPEDHANYRSAEASKLRLTGAEDWSLEDFIDIDPSDGDRIVALTHVQDHLLVLKQSSVWALYGNTDDGFQSVKITDRFGGLSPKSIVNTPHGVFFFSVPDGVYHYTGGASLTKMSGPIGRWYFNTDDERSRVALGYGDNKLFVSLQNPLSSQLPFALRYPTVDVDSPLAGRSQRNLSLGPLYRNTTMVYDFERESWYEWSFHAAAFLNVVVPSAGSELAFYTSMQVGDPIPPDDAPGEVIPPNFYTFASELSPVIFDQYAHYTIPDAESALGVNHSIAAELLLNPRIIVGPFGGSEHDEFPWWRSLRLEFEFVDQATGKSHLTNDPGQPYAYVQYWTDNDGLGELDLTTTGRWQPVLASDVSEGVFYTNFPRRGRLLWVDIELDNPNARLVRVAAVFWPGTRHRRWN